MWKSTDSAVKVFYIITYFKLSRLGKADHEQLPSWQCASAIVYIWHWGDDQNKYRFVWLQILVVQVAKEDDLEKLSDDWTEAFLSTADRLILALVWSCWVVVNILGDCKSWCTHQATNCKEVMGGASLGAELEDKLHLNLSKMRRLCLLLELLRRDRSVCSVLCAGRVQEKGAAL